MLGGDAAAQGFDALDIACRNGLGMVDDEAGLERCFAVDPLEHGEEPVDGLVIGGVNAERPFVGGEQFDNRLQLAFHHRCQVRARLQEILEIGCRPVEIFARTIHAQHGVASPRLGQGQPALIVVEFLPGGLGKKVIGNPHGQLAGIMQLLHDVIIFRIILATAASVDNTGDAQPVKLAHEVAG